MAGVTADLHNEGLQYEGTDSIVIVSNLETVPGGRTLDVTGYTPEVIKSGHIVIEETSTGNCKPMPINGEDYGTLPAGHTIKGIVIATVLSKSPFVGISVRGSVNKVASPYPVTTAIEEALPLIRFVKD